MADTKVKKRNRSLEISEEVKKTGATVVDAGLLLLAVETFKLNLVQNKAKRDYEKKRAELLGAMKKAKLTDKIFTGVSLHETKPGEDEVLVALKAEVKTPINEKANVRKLQKLVDAETFLTMVSATKDAIVTFAGLAVFEQCKEEVTGTENVSVSLYKEE